MQKDRQGLASVWRPHPPPPYKKREKGRSRLHLHGLTSVGARCARTGCWPLALAHTYASGALQKGQTFPAEDHTRHTPGGHARAQRPLLTAFAHPSAVRRLWQHVPCTTAQAVPSAGLAFLFVQLFLQSVEASFSVCPNARAPRCAVVPYWKQMYVPAKRRDLHLRRPASR